MAVRIRTGYSFKTAVGHLPEVLSRIREVGWGSFPITDRGSTHGFVKWTKLCKEASHHPIYGVELPVVEDVGVKKSPTDYWTFVATSDLRPLHDLIYKCTEHGGLTYDEASTAEGVFKITGNRTNLDKIKRGHVGLYFGLSPSTPLGLYKRAKALKHKMMATSDNVFTRKEDEEFYRVTLGFRSSTQTYPQHILDDMEWMRSVGFADRVDMESAIKNRELCMGGCTAKLDRAELFVPVKEKTLRQLCIDGAKVLKVDLKNPVYQERLDRELALIDAKDFADYFHIVADLMQYARKHMVVGPARGSSCGSLVCYLLGITSVDPIPYDLVFERFIDITRTDLPDIDLDFSDKKRQIVLDYVAKKYGQAHVARLGSVNMLKAKSALNAVGIALKIPAWQINEVSNTVVKRATGDSRADSTVLDAIEGTDVGKTMLRDHPGARIAARLEGHPASAGQHAAGVVITKGDILDYVAVDHATGAAMCDKKDAEELNLIKIDMLGLKQLSTFERVMELLKVPVRSEFLEKIPMGDQAAFDILNNLKMSGIFQFDPNSTMASLLKEFVRDNPGKIDRFEDYAALTALVRPGPMGSGQYSHWIRRRIGTEKVDYPHPLFEKHLSNTFGIVVYQEQVMTIGKDIGGLSWEDVTALRKAMSRSLGKEYFDQFGDKWKSGAKKSTGLSDRVLGAFWDNLCEYGMWSFNRSHSVAYGLVSYWCCWLKAHHPVEFAAATLDAEGDVSKQVLLLRDLAKEGIDYVPIDADLSSDRWEIKKTGKRKSLLGPLTNIKGIGPKTLEEILDARRTKTPLRENLAKKLERAKTSLDTLSPIADAIHVLHPDLSQIGIVTDATPIAEAEASEYPMVIMGKVTKIAPLDENETARVARRGRKVDGPTKAINVYLADDTGEVFCKIGRYDFASCRGGEFVAQARPRKSLYAFKGKMCHFGFRMMQVQQVKYLGEIE